jgi:hypothetical protein
MKPKSGGNGSGKIDIGIQDMGGWVQVRLSRNYDLPEDIHVGLSAALAQWFRQNPHKRLRFAVPIQRDGNTIALHAWYDVVLLPDASGAKLEGQA